MKCPRMDDLVWATIGAYGWRAARVEFPVDRRGWVTLVFLDPRTGARRGYGRRRPHQLVPREKLRFGADKPSPLLAAELNQ